MDGVKGANHNTRLAFEGVVAFPVTPFRGDLTLDVEGLRRNVRALLREAPPCAIVAAGGTGELYSLTPDEHLEVVRTVVEAAGGVPVIAGVGFNAAMAVPMAAAAERAGAAGILAFPPYYPNADESGLVEYYRAIGDASPQLVIYSRDWFHPGPALVERLAAIQTLAAWKDGQGDIRRLQALMDAVGSRLVWVGGAGDDLVPAYYAAGIRAFTSSVWNVAPRLSRDLHDRASHADTAGLADPMSRVIVPLYALRARRRGYEVTVMKALMDALDLTGGRVRPPLAELATEDATRLAALAPYLEIWKFGNLEI
jgi:5-dehydro-4-deoxyglucarate dehydratase